MLPGLEHSSTCSFLCQIVAHLALYTLYLQGLKSLNHLELHQDDHINLVRRSSFFGGSPPTGFRPEDLGLHQWRVSPPNSSSDHCSSHRTHRCVLRVGSCCGTFLVRSFTKSPSTGFCQRHTDDSWHILLFHYCYFHQ